MGGEVREGIKRAEKRNWRGGKEKRVIEGEEIKILGR